jgi:hypothetical protein
MFTLDSAVVTPLRFVSDGGCSRERHRDREIQRQRGAEGESRDQRAVTVLMFTLDSAVVMPLRCVCVCGWVVGRGRREEGTDGEFDSVEEERE